MPRSLALSLDAPVGVEEILAAFGDSRARGTIEAAVPGAPVSAIGKVMLVSLATGARLDFSTTVRVNIPLVGGQVENFIVSRLGDEISAVQRFTDNWIVANR
jgi:hypothetical protein